MFVVFLVPEKTQDIMIISLIDLLSDLDCKSSERLSRTIVIQTLIISFILKGGFFQKFSYFWG